MMAYSGRCPECAGPTQTGVLRPRAEARRLRVCLACGWAIDTDDHLARLQSLGRGAVHMVSQLHVLAEALPADPLAP